MTQNAQVPWTDEQWARVNQVIQEEASRARVAATFLPLYGPLPPDTDFVREETVTSAPPTLKINDTKTIRLATLQINVSLRGAQMADPNMTSVLQVFRRAANILARLEDAVVFRGQTAEGNGPLAGAPPGGNNLWKIYGGRETPGLLGEAAAQVPILNNGQSLVQGISKSIGDLETKGHFGPFAAVLGQDLFLTAQTPEATSLVLPQDRIIPFLGSGPLLRSSTLPDREGVVVALGGGAVELVIATDVSFNFLQVTIEPEFVFRVFERMVLRIKEKEAIVRLVPDGGAPRLAPVREPGGRRPRPVTQTTATEL